MARRALVDIEGNTGANTRDKSCQKPPAGHLHGGGLDEETTNTRDGRWHYRQPREGGKCLTEKKNRTNITHKKNKRWHTDPYIALYHVTREKGTLVARRLQAEEGVGRAKLKNDGKATALRLR